MSAILAMGVPVYWQYSVWLVVVGKNAILAIVSSRIASSCASVRSATRSVVDGVIVCSIVSSVFVSGWC